MIHTQVKVFFTLLFLSVTVLFLSLLNIFQKEKELSFLEKNRFEFYVLATQLEQNHLDFNAIVNDYIVNDNQKYASVLNPLIGVTSLIKVEDVRQEILKQLNLNHHDYSMQDIQSQKHMSFLKTIEFSNDLYNRIIKAQSNSLDVLLLNIEALNAYHGYERNNLGQYVVVTKPNKQKAIQIIYGNDFKNLNQKIQDSVEHISDDIEVLVSKYIEKKDAEQEKFYKYAIYLLVIILLMIIMGVFFAQNNILKPLKKLLHWTRSIEEGNFDLHLEYKAKNEIGILKRAFYDMAHQIQDNLNALEKASLTDQLTQLYNRRALDNKLEELYENFERYKTIFSVVIIDIDFFKSVNDTYGHDVGDSVLKEFALILKKSIRKTDMVGRWGGEEFLVIAPNTSHDEVKKLAEGIRKKIELYSFKVVGSKTASFGTSEIKENMAILDVIEKADEALYFSKENGRNRVS